MTNYPRLAGVAIGEPSTTEEWVQTYAAAVRVIGSPHLRSVLGATFARAYVDEYQDCTRIQHDLVLALAEEVPMSVLGDPLQGIFALGKESLVDWDIDVLPSFPDLPVASEPWRWRGHNDALGDWLGSARQVLLAEEPLRLDDAPVGWRKTSPQFEARACQDACNATDSVVVLRKWANQCHKIAKRLNGAFTSMEELAGKDILKMAEEIDAASGEQAAAALLDIASRCLTNLPSGVTTAKKRYAQGQRPQPKSGSPYAEIYDALAAVANDRGHESLLTAMRRLEECNGAFLHRRECWGELKRALRSQHAEGGSLADAALRVREQTRRTGRRPARRVVSRTLLVKGLEYDHAVVLDADALNVKHLYVAITRGRKNLTILSSRPELRPAT